MPAPHLVLFCILALFGGERLAASALTWEKTVLEIQAAPLAEKVDAVYRFTNTGRAKVTIVSTAASCGCTVAQVAKTVYAPGETGELHALFTPDDRTGFRQEEVAVMTDDSGGTPQILVLRITVPKLYEVTPYFLLWHAGEKPEVKKATIHIFDSALLTPVSIQSHDPRVLVTLERDPAGPGDYTVLVHPASTATPLDTVMSVELSSRNGIKRVISLYAVVRVPPSQLLSNPPTTSAAPTTAPSLAHERR